MQFFQVIALCLTVVCYANAYTKYGRSCADIVCLSSEECVMREDPCTRVGRACGNYPSCERIGSSHASNQQSAPGEDGHAAQPTRPTSCSQVRCPLGYYCRLFPTQCYQAPCPKAPMCVRVSNPADRVTPTLRT